MRLAKCNAGDRLTSKVYIVVVCILCVVMSTICLYYIKGDMICIEIKVWR